MYSCECGASYSDYFGASQCSRRHGDLILELRSKLDTERAEFDRLFEKQAVACRERLNDLAIKDASIKALQDEVREKSRRLDSIDKLVERFGNYSADEASMGWFIEEYENTRRGDARNAVSDEEGGTVNAVIAGLARTTPPQGAICNHNEHLGTIRHGEDVIRCGNCGEPVNKIVVVERQTPNE